MFLARREGEGERERETRHLTERGLHWHLFALCSSLIAPKFRVPAYCAKATASSQGPISECLPVRVSTCERAES